MIKTVVLLLMSIDPEIVKKMRWRLCSLTTFSHLKFNAEVCNMYKHFKVCFICSGALGLEPARWWATITAWDSMITCLSLSKRHRDVGR
jgi:hypothetical protein